jgi:hypothetical protein
VSIARIIFCEFGQKYAPCSLRAKQNKSAARKARNNLATLKFFIVLLSKRSSNQFSRLVTCSREGRLCMAAAAYQRTRFYGALSHLVEADVTAGAVAQIEGGFQCIWAQFPLTSLLRAAVATQQ